MQNIKLIASDIDGTLLLNGATEIDSRTLELLGQLTKHGVIFAAASGRQYENMRRLFDPIKDDIAYICYNGALCIFRGEVIERRYFDKALATEILSAVDQTDDCDGMASADGAELIAPRHSDLLDHMTGYIKADYRVVGDLPSCPEPFYKVAMYNGRGDLSEAYWRSRFGGRCSVVTSGNVWLDRTRTSPYQFYQFWLNVRRHKGRVRRFRRQRQRPRYARGRRPAGRDAKRQGRHAPPRPDRHPHRRRRAGTDPARVRRLKQFIIFLIKSGSAIAGLSFYVAYFWCLHIPQSIQNALPAASHHRQSVFLFVLVHLKVRNIRQ